MKIYTRVVLDIETGKVLEEESYEYQGPVAQCISLGMSSSESDPTRVDVWNKAQKELFNTIWPIILKGAKGPVSAYPGKMYVPRTPEEQRYLGLADPSSLENEAFYQEGIKAPAMREWSNIVEPTIKSQYAGPGYWGSARADAVTKGAEDLATNLAKARSEMTYKGIEAAAPYSRQIAQEQAAGDFQRWLSGETVDGQTPSQYSPFMQIALQILGLTPFAVGQRANSTSWSGGVSSGGIPAKTKV